MKNLIKLFLFSFLLIKSQTISLNPDSIYIEMFPGDTTLETFTIFNTGADTLEVNIAPKNCGDYTIFELPYSHSGSTLGMQDDWPVNNGNSAGPDNAYFLNVITNDDTIKSKPDPEPYNMMIEKLKVQLKSHLRETQSNLNATLIPSSVIVLIIQTESAYKILFNKRTYNVQDHKGEISFPGGRKDKSDQDLLSTALREFEEEMGVASTNIDIIGKLSDVVTSSNYLITPYVGTTSSKLHFSPNPKEVELIIQILKKIIIKIISLFWF